MDPAKDAPRALPLLVTSCVALGAGLVSASLLSPPGAEREGTARADPARAVPAATAQPVSAQDVAPASAPDAGNSRPEATAVQADTLATADSAPGAQAAAQVELAPPPAPAPADVGAAAPAVTAELASIPGGQVSLAPPPPADQGTAARLTDAPPAESAAASGAMAVETPAPAEPTATAPAQAPPPAPPAATRPAATPLDLRGRGPQPPMRSRSVEPGLVAYLRCEGLETRPGPFPCPRDRVLERALWGALDQLSSCERDPGRGEGEVRLVFGRGVATDPIVRDRGRGAAHIDTAAVRECVGDALRALRTELQPERMIVSFRFRLR